MANLIRISEEIVNFDGTNIVKIPTSANMSGIIIETLATPGISKQVRIQAELWANSGAGAVIKTQSGTGAGYADTITVTDLATSGIFFVKSVVSGTLTVSSIGATKITFGSTSIAGALQPDDALHITGGDGSAISPLLYVQSVTGSDAICGYTNAPVQAAVPVTVLILGRVIKDKIIVDGKVSISGSASYFEASLPANFISDQLNITDGDINGVRLVLDSEASKVKFIEISWVDIAAGKYYFNSLGTGLKTGDTITGHMWFNPKFTFIPYDLFNISTYKHIVIPANAIQPGDALVTIKTVSPI